LRAAIAGTCAGPSLNGAPRAVGQGLVPSAIPRSSNGSHAGFLKFGTDGYPRAVQRRLRIVNAMTLLIAVFSVIYAAVLA